jgi:hypothetical protein
VSAFLDTGVLVAFVNADDPLHPRARRAIVAASEGAWGQPWTSDYVLAEGYNFLRRRVKRQEVADALSALVLGRPGHAPLVRDVLRVNAGVFASAREQYFRHWSAGLSLTDWTSLELMAQRDIETLVTFDAGFEAWCRVAP